MQKTLVLLLLISLICVAGCGYRFNPEDLESVEIHYSTGMEDWEKGILERIDTIDFKKRTASFEHDIAYDEVAENITSFLNDEGIGIGRYSKNESCEMSNIEAGYLIILLSKGSIFIEEDICDNQSISTKAYSDILGMI